MACLVSAGRERAGRRKRRRSRGWRGGRGGEVEGGEEIWGVLEKGREEGEEEK